MAVKGNFDQKKRTKVTVKREGERVGREKGERERRGEKEKRERE